MYDHANPTHRTELRAEVVANQGYYGDPGSTRYVLAFLHDTKVSRTVSPARTTYGLTGSQLGSATTLYNIEYVAAVNDRAKEVWIDLLVGFGESEIPFVHHAQLLNIFTAALAPTIRAALFHRRMCELEVLFGPGSTMALSDYRIVIGPGTPGPRMNPSQQREYVDAYMNNYNASTDDIKAGKRSRTEEHARITAKAVAKEAPGSTRTWS